jgi:hypothetical protein
MKHLALPPSHSTFSSSSSSETISHESISQSDSNKFSPDFVPLASISISNSSNSSFTRESTPNNTQDYSPSPSPSPSPFSQILLTPKLDSLKSKCFSNEESPLSKFKSFGHQLTPPSPFNAEKSHSNFSLKIRLKKVVPQMFNFHSSMYDMDGTQTKTSPNVGDKEEIRTPPLKFQDENIQTLKNNSVPIVPLKRSPTQRRISFQSPMSRSLRKSEGSELANIILPNEEKNIHTTNINFLKDDPKISHIKSPLKRELLPIHSGRMMSRFTKKHDLNVCLKRSSSSSDLPVLKLNSFEKWEDSSQTTENSSLVLNDHSTNKSFPSLASIFHFKMNEDGIVICQKDFHEMFDFQQFQISKGEEVKILGRARKSSSWCVVEKISS